jgi:hypothetical protein
VEKEVIQASKELLDGLLDQGETYRRFLLPPAIHHEQLGKIPEEGVNHRVLVFRQYRRPDSADTGQIERGNLFPGIAFSRFHIDTKERSRDRIGLGHEGLTGVAPA